MARLSCYLRWGAAMERCDRDWMQSAACSNLGAKVEFVTDQDLRPAQYICQFCPVAGECLLWATVFDEEGVWGGTPEYERRRTDGRACEVCGRVRFTLSDNEDSCAVCGSSNTQLAC